MSYDDVQYERPPEWLIPAIGDQTLDDPYECDDTRPEYPLGFI